MKVTQYIIGKWEYMYVFCIEKRKRETTSHIYSRIKFYYFNSTSTTRACIQSVTKVFNVSSINKLFYRNNNSILYEIYNIIFLLRRLNQFLKYCIFYFFIYFYKIENFKLLLYY